MKISKIHLKNFKRFTELTIDQIPLDTKLVLLIGANGSGKSSVFDAFDFLQWRILNGTLHENFLYFRKIDAGFEINLQFESESLNIKFTNEGDLNDAHKNREILKKFFGRSSIRIIPKISNQGNTGVIITDSDRPKSFTQNDTRFINDVYSYIEDIDKALREPVFSGRSADTLQIFQDFIKPLNSSLIKIFGGDEKTTIQIAEFKNASSSQSANLIFRKGESKINYDLLSHGEKQVIILLLNFIVRKKYYEDAIIFIDEMDCHLNTALQFNLLKEITEVWIPDNSQLWTASHALGFIDYAHKTQNAQIIDFDLRDYDIPQVLVPEPKENIEVYEIAVGKDILATLFKQMNIVFVENNDKEYYANIEIPNTIFVSDNNRNSVFHKVRTTDYKGIVDRDFLSDGDIFMIRKNYPNLFILNYYSIENYIYHPDNLEEYYSKQDKFFDKNQYIEQLIDEKNLVNKRIGYEIKTNRNSYPYFKEPKFNGSELQKRFKDEKENSNETIIIGGDLDSDDFETFYKSLPMKTYCKNLPQRQNIPKSELTKTDWFKNQIAKIIL